MDWTKGPRRDWQEAAPIEPSAELRAAVGGHRLLAEYLARQGIRTAADAGSFLSPAQYQPASAAELPDIDRAVQRLRRAIKREERILIWGDFDVDGQTSTALLYIALRRLGANVAYHVPNRFSEGHGIHLKTLERYINDGIETAGGFVAKAADAPEAEQEERADSELEAAVASGAKVVDNPSEMRERPVDRGIDLLLTCDTGVTAQEAVQYAASRGVHTIITDHHALPERLPPALAVINPQRLPVGHALRELPGVGVAYKLVEALYGNDDCEDLLDLVALGIVADVMVQVDDTRYLLQRGLDRLRENQRPGLRAILQSAQIPPAELNEGHIGFAIAPRLNALGRLEDANPAVELLTTKDWARARILANELEALNVRRKYLTNQIYESAIAQIERKPELLDYAALVLSHSDWHSGVIGIVASRLVEEFAVPVVLLAVPDVFARGSARSVAGLDIYAALGQVAALLHSYGGHSMAAGLSLPADNIITFRRELSRVLRAMGGGVATTSALTIDGYLTLPEISLALAQDIERLAPFGNGNPPLTLATKNLSLASRRQLGRRGDHLQVLVEDEDGNRQRVIWWRGADKDLPSGRFDLAYTVRSSSYKGQREALVEWLDYRALAGSPLELADKALAQEIIDRRQSANPLAELAALRQKFPAALVWAEVDALADAANRLQLSPCETLIVWTIPPSAEIWAAALATVNPTRLVLFGARPPTERQAQFLARLAGLVKYAINQKGGAVDLEDLAAALGQREQAALVGLRELRASGQIDFRVKTSGQIQLGWAAAPPRSKPGRWRERLTLLLREARAYRNYWLAQAMRAF